jgi:tetratricopeptide (TPR) repeat protein
MSQRRRFAVDACHFAILFCIALYPSLWARARGFEAEGGTPNFVQPKTKSSGFSLVPVPYPDLSRMEPTVRHHLETVRSELRSVSETAGVSRAQVAEAFGQLGKIYQAYELSDAAIPCFLNAETLDPHHFAWLYYLGFAYEIQGDHARAATYLENALKIQPNNLTALLRLAKVKLDLNSLEPAKAIFERALAIDKSSAAALAGLGKIALYKRDFSEAVQKLNTALVLQPEASSLRYPLAIAYRGLGDLAQADANLQKKGKGEPKIVDPLVDELQRLRRGNPELWMRGTQAINANRFGEAVSAFRQLVTLDGSNPDSRMYLGIALARLGQRSEATEQFSQTLRILPEHAGAHYNLGLLLAEKGFEQEAIRHFRAAVQSNPELRDAHFQLANLLMRGGSYQEAVSEYRSVVAMDPANAFCRFMEAMALIRLKKYSTAKNQLEAGLAALPGDVDMESALARLLAACPDPEIRNGSRALELTEQAYRAQQNADLEQGETVAMALAAIGLYPKAAQLQRSLIAEAERYGRNDLVHALRDNLVLYEHGKSCRKPWRDDDPVFKPLPRTNDLSSNP